MIIICLSYVISKILQFGIALIASIVIEKCLFANKLKMYKPSERVCTGYDSLLTGTDIVAL